MTKPLLLGGATVLAAVHVLGVLFTTPIIRYAEALALVLLLIYAVLAGLPSPRWALPAAVVVLIADALRTLPAAATNGFGSHFEPAGTLVAPTGFQIGLSATGAGLLFVLLIGVASRGPLRLRRAIVPVVLVASYAFFRAGDLLSLVAPAIFVPLMLAIAAAVLATVLISRGHRLAGAGAALLVIAGLLHLDQAVAAVPLPYAVYASHRSAAYVITDPLALTGAAVAIAVAAELTAYLMIVAGLCGRDLFRGVPPQSAPTPGEVG